MRDVIWSLIILMLIASVSVTTVGYKKLQALNAAQRIEIAQLNLDKAELEGVLLGPHLVEALINDTGAVLVRIDGNDAFIYEFPRLCRNPGTNGNL